MNRLCLLYLLILFIPFLTFSQSSDYIIRNDLESPGSENPWINLHTVVKGDAKSGASFSRTDSVNPYGIGWKGTVPLLFQKKNIKLTISAFARLSETTSKSSIVISIIKNDSTVYWESRPVKSNITEKNLWFSIQEEVRLPMNITGSDYSLHVYVWNEDGKGICDLDDIAFTFSKVEFPSFMIRNDTVPAWSQNNSGLEVYSGNYYKMQYDKFSGQFRILSSSGKILLHSFSIFLSFRRGTNNSGNEEEIFKSAFFLRSDSLSEEGKYFTLESRTEISNTEVRILFSASEPQLRFRITTGFSGPVQLTRHSLSSTSGPEISQVYTNSATVDTGTFQDEYWIKRGGFQANTDSAGFILYLPENISSLQLAPKKRRMCINLDWEMDHPLLRWPLMKESSNYKENISSSQLEPGDIISGEFTIQGVQQTRLVPRLMKYPSGKTAAVIWTEHADYSDLRLQQAVNFGSGDIHSSSDAVGGFVKYRIPVTKSVFYSNPDHVKNSEKVGFLDSEIANVKGTPGFREFLLDLKEQGQEICLHTPDQYTTSRRLLEEALTDMKRDFNCVSWIDHGYDNAKKSNRENLVCDGLDEKSDYFAADLWKEYGLHYFWNCFYEDTTLYSNYTFNSFLSVPYSGWGDRFPVPEYWKHPSRSSDLIHWRTSGTLDPPDSQLWNYYFSEARMQDLLQSRRTAVLHAYPARADSSNGFYFMNEGNFQIRKEFDGILQRQSLLRDQGFLHLSTIRDYLDYQMALDQVEVRFLSNGKVEIKNKSLYDLKGLTFLIPSASVTVDNKIIQSRQELNEWLFWFDLNKGESVQMDLH